MKTQQKIRIHPLEVPFFALKIIANGVIRAAFLCAVCLFIFLIAFVVIYALATIAFNAVSSVGGALAPEAAELAQTMIAASSAFVAISISILLIHEWRKND